MKKKDNQKCSIKGYILETAITNVNNKTQIGSLKET